MEARGGKMSKFKLSKEETLTYDCSNGYLGIYTRYKGDKILLRRPSVEELLFLILMEMKK